MSSSGQQADAKASSQNDGFEQVRKDIIELLKQPEYDDGSAGPVLVRLAWHSSGTYDAETKTGGSNGAGMRYEAEGGDEANAGLQHARAFLEPVKAKHPWISYADLWILAGVTAIEAMGGPVIPFKPGRTDFADDSKCPPRGRLPDASQAADHIRAVFGRMGFNDQEMVALSGAHNLGRCHSDRSGFHGPWVPNGTRFSNTYFRLLMNNEWTVKEWDGPKQYSNTDFDEELMMLPTDMALVQDPKFKPWVEKYAKDRDLFYEHFGKAFHKLTELGVNRDETEYKVADKKADTAQASGSGNGSAGDLAKDNESVQERARKGGCPVYRESKL